jgi:hypothetical protein
MSRIARKRKAGTFVFYACVAIVAALLWMYRMSIMLGIVSFLNSVINAYDSLSGG